MESFSRRHLPQAEGFGRQAEDTEGKFKYREAFARDWGGLEGVSFTEGAWSLPMAIENNVFKRLNEHCENKRIRTNHAIAFQDWMHLL